MKVLIRCWLPLGLNDLATELNKPGKGEETLAADLNDRENELENQNELFKLTAADQSFSSAGILAPSLESTASQVPAEQIVIPATVDPTQENALAALQILKVSFMNPLSLDSMRILVVAVLISQLFLYHVDNSRMLCRYIKALFSPEPMLLASLRFGALTLTSICIVDKYNVVCCIMC